MHAGTYLSGVGHQIQQQAPTEHVCSLPKLGRFWSLSNPLLPPNTVPVLDVKVVHSTEEDTDVDSNKVVTDDDVWICVLDDS